MIGGYSLHHVLLVAHSLSGAGSEFPIWREESINMTRQTAQVYSNDHGHTMVRGGSQFTLK